MRPLVLERLEDRRLLAAALGQFAWLDVNGDGIRQSGEPGVAGAVVELFDAVDGVRGDGDDLSLGARITDASGCCQFTGLDAGDYYLQFRPPVGLAFTQPRAGSDDALDSDAERATGRTALFSLAADQADWSRDAGLVGSTPEFGFAVAAGGGALDESRAIAADAAGNLYVTGRFTGEVDFDPGPGELILTSAGGGDIFVAKYSSAGAVVWARAMGGAEDGDEGLAAAADSTGALYVAGEFRGVADFDPVPGRARLVAQGEQDVFIAKLSTDGELLWVKRIGGAGSDRAAALALDSAGDVFAAGAFQETVDFDPGAGVVARTSAGSDDAFVMKLDASGTFQWARAAGGAGSDRGAALAVDSLGGVFVGGDFSETADFDPGPGRTLLTSAGGRDAFLWKLDAGGVLQWARRMGGVEEDGLAGLAADSEGGVYGAGSFGATAPFGQNGGAAALTSRGGQDVFIVRYAANGDLLWARSVGGGGEDQGRAIAAGSAGRVYVTGVYEGVADFDPGGGVAALDSSDAGGAFVLALDGGGDLAYASGLGGGVQRSRGLALGPANEILIAGQFEGTADFDPGPDAFLQLSAGDADAFVLQLKLPPAPTVLLPPTPVVPEDALLPVKGLALADADAATQLAVTLTAGAGALTVRTDAPGGLSLSDIVGSGANSVRLNGPLPAINATLAAPGGLTYRSDPDFNGSDTITITVSNDGPAGGGPFEITRDSLALIVAPVNDAPQAEWQIVDAVEDVTLAVELSGDDGDPEMDQSLAFEIVSLPATGRLSATPDGPPITPDDLPYRLSGSVVYFVTAPNDVAMQQFEFIVVDDGGTAGGGRDTSDPASVMIRVAPVNDPPRANELHLTAIEDIEREIILTGDDGDPEADQPLTFVLDSLADAATLSQTSGGEAITADQLPLVLDGDRLYFRAADYDDEFPRTFDFHVLENAGPTGDVQIPSEKAEVAVDVVLVNDPPTAPDLTVEMLEDQIVFFALAGDDGDEAEEQELTYILTSLPAEGTLEQAGGGPILTADQLPLELDDGVLLYTAPPDVYGEQTFHYYVQDDGGVAHGGADTSGVGTVTIRVGPVNDPPELTGPTTLTVLESSHLPVAGVAVADSDAERNDIQVELSVLHGTLDVQTGGALSDADVFGNGSSHVVLRGSVAEINDALGRPDGVLYDSSSGFQGVDSLVITADDLGNTGRGPSGRDVLQVEIAVLDDFPWRNPDKPLDVNNDGSVSRLDALLLINRLNGGQFGLLPLPPPGPAPPPYLDPSGDNALTAVDVLYVISALNTPLMAEGESPAAGSRAESSTLAASGFSAPKVADALVATEKQSVDSTAPAPRPIALPPLRAPLGATSPTGRTSFDPIRPTTLTPGVEESALRSAIGDGEANGVDEDAFGEAPLLELERVVDELAREMAERVHAARPETAPLDSLLDEGFPRDSLGLSVDRDLTPPQAKDDASLGKIDR